MLSPYTLDVKTKTFNYRHKSMYSQYVDKNSASVMIQGLLKREKGPPKK